MSYTLKSDVSVDLRHDGTDYSGTFKAGDVELPEPVAVLLVGQGLATPTTKKVSKSADQTDTTTEA